MLGAASGAVAGLVAITPAAGNVGIGGALVIGFVAGFACLWGVNGLKKCWALTTPWMCSVCTVWAVSSARC
jgi:ammonia channel protein AmtB